MAIKTAVLCVGHGTSKEGGVSPIDKFQVEKATEIIKKQKIGDVVLCGGNNFKDGLKEADLMAGEIEKKGLDANIFKETESKNTVEQAINAKKIVEEKGFEKIIFVCWEGHIPRAPFVFKKVLKGKEIEVIPTKGVFGGNSQWRLNTQIGLFFWEAASWIYTLFVLYILRVS